MIQSLTKKTKHIYKRYQYYKNRATHLTKYNDAKSNTYIMPQIENIIRKSVCCWRQIVSEFTYYDFFYKPRFVIISVNNVLPCHFHYCNKLNCCYIVCVKNDKMSVYMYIVLNKHSLLFCSAISLTLRCCWSTSRPTLLIDYGT